MLDGRRRTRERVHGKEDREGRKRPRGKRTEAGKVSSSGAGIEKSRNKADREWEIRR